MKTEADKLRNSIQYGLGVMDAGSGEFKELSNKIDELFELSYLEGQSNPKIKQLEWEHSLYNTLLSKTLIGDYTIAPMKDGYHMYLYSKNQYYWLKDYMNTIDEAKQFAQTDFENRVKECLTIE